MRTVAQLKEAGFTFRKRDNAVDCTEVSSVSAFWFYNQNFFESMRSVRANLGEAEFETGAYRITVAGEFQDDELFPFNLLDAQRKEAMDDAWRRYTLHSNEAQRAQSDFEDMLRTAEPIVA